MYRMGFLHALAPQSEWRLLSRSAVTDGTVKTACAFAPALRRASEGKPHSPVKKEGHLSVALSLPLDVHRRGRRCDYRKAVKRWVRCDPRHSLRHVRPQSAQENGRGEGLQDAEVAQCGP